MTRPSATQPSDKLSRAISISFSAHCAVFAIFFLKMTFFPSQPIEIKRAMRVDLVGLPDKMQTLPPVEAPAAPPKVEAPAPAATPAPTPAAPPKVAEAPKVPVKDKKADTKKLEKSQTSAVERIKQMEALAKLERQQKEAQAKAAKAAAAAAAQVRGNQLSKGNGLTGLEQIEYDRYFDEIEKTVHSNWAVPEWLNSAQLRAQVQVLIDKTGHVTDKKITKSSGNETFDAEVLGAIDKSSPFPQPPARLQGVLANSGIVFNFPD